MATLHGLFYYYVCLRIISYCIVPASSVKLHIPCADLLEPDSPGVGRGRMVRRRFDLYCDKT
jgi:hypothetical protein